MNMTKASVSMSSKEIAELTDKEHYNVIADIEKMLKDLDVSALKFQGTYKDKQNKDQKAYNLDKDHTLALVSGYSVKLRMAIIKRLGELEGQTKPMTQVEVVAAQGQILLEHERQLAAIPILQEEVKELKAKADHNDHIFHFGEYTSIKAYCNVKKITITSKQAAAVGRQCSSRCRKERVAVKKFPCPTYGEVNGYPEDIISEVMVALGYIE